MTKLGLAAATVGILVAQALPGALAQTQVQPFVARADVNVENDSAVPQTVAGTNVAPFELMPHQQAILAMSVAPPPAPTAPGSSVPVRFEYSVGLTGGPQCVGTIDMTLDAQSLAEGRYETTNCDAHSLGTGGAHCQIAVSAQKAACRGGLAFAAQ